MKAKNENGKSSMMMSKRAHGGSDFDVAILGAGISGTVLGAILARHGYSVVMFDSEVHPRFAIGESTVGRTTAMMAILAARYDVPELAHLATFRGCLENVTSAGGIKRAVSFLYHRPGEQRAEEANQFVIPPIFHGPEMHMFRQDTDAYLLSVCSRYGATIHQGTKIKKVDIDDRVKLQDDKGRSFSARYIVDCSGYKSPVATQFGLRETPTRLKHQSRSLFTHMIGVKSYDELVHPRGKHQMPIPWFQSTLHHIFPGGWVWVIPFNNHARATNPLCSVGLTLDPRMFPKTGMSPDEEFRKLLAPYPSVIEQFSSANAIRPWVSTDRLQYSASRATGKRFCLMAHSYGFVDPLFSRGLATTTDIVNTLAARLMKALDDDDFSEDRFEYIDRLSRGLLDSTDDLVNCAFTAFKHYPLFNAWIRVWALGEAGLDFLRLLNASLGFRQTGDRGYFDALDDVPYPGLICPNHDGYRTIFYDSVRDIESVAAGTLDAQIAADNVFRRVHESNLMAPNIRLGDPDARLVPGDLLTSTQAFLWGRFASPKDLRKRFYGMSLSSMFEHARGNIRELTNPYT